MSRSAEKTHTQMTASNRLEHKHVRAPRQANRARAFLQPRVARVEVAGSAADGVGGKARRRVHLAGCRRCAIEMALGELAGFCPDRGGSEVPRMQEPGIPKRKLTVL